MNDASPPSGKGTEAPTSDEICEVCSCNKFFRSATAYKAHFEAAPGGRSEHDWRIETHQPLAGVAWESALS